LLLNVRIIYQYLEFLKLSGIQDIFVSGQEKNNQNESVKADLEDLAGKYVNCTDCELCENRIKLVYGEGNPQSKLMIISEGPGNEENLTGRPFVGAAGKLLTKMLMAINIERKDIYITNVVKCRPPGNRDPYPEEVQACSHILQEQIDIIQPKLLLILGKVAAESLLKQSQSLGAYRKMKNYYQGIRAFVTYHPAALLRNSEWKKPAWIDLQNLQKEYEKIL
jgi:DNA polymerase